VFHQFKQALNQQGEHGGGYGQPILTGIRLAPAFSAESLDLPSIQNVSG
jgi:hypothetical protein